jgi:hypothetical protein
VALTPVEIDVEGERHQATPPVVLGRTRGAGSQDALAVKTPNGEVLHVFKGVYARWGCAGSDTDCTSSTQLEIAVEGGALVVRNVGKFPTYSQGQPIDRIVLGPGQWAELTLPGVYTHDGKKARIIIKTPGVKHTMQPATDAVCEACCEAWRIISQVYDHVKEARVMTAKELEDLERLFPRFTGSVAALEEAAAEVSPDAVRELVRELVSAKQLIKSILSQLKQENLPPETIENITYMYFKVDRLRKKLTCRC